MFLHAVSKIALTTASLVILASVVALTTTLHFDVVSILLPSSTNSTNSRHHDDDNQRPTSTPASWVSFLGGEFTWSVLFPLSMYAIMAVSIRPPRKSLLPGGMCVFNLIGLLTAHGILYQYVQSQQVDSIDVVVRNTKWIGALLGLNVMYIVSSNVTTMLPSNAFSDKPSSTSQPHFPWIVRGVVKLGAILQIATAIAVIGMGVSTHEPMDLMQNLIWEGPHGYRYDIFQTYGEETVLSFAFFYVLLSTMMATIFQTLLVGLWVLISPIMSDATSEGLTAGVVGVLLIIFANIITMVIYDNHFNGFAAGKECMMGHIALLVQANLYIPIVWLLYQVSRWYGALSATSIEKKNN